METALVPEHTSAGGTPLAKHKTTRSSTGVSMGGVKCSSVEVLLGSARTVNREIGAVE